MTSSPLTIVHGSLPGKRLTIKHNGEFIDLGLNPDGTKLARLQNWSQVAILAGAKARVRCWIVGPNDSGPEATVGFDPFVVHGFFQILTLCNNADKARDLFHEWKPPVGGQ